VLPGPRPRGVLSAGHLRRPWRGGLGAAGPKQKTAQSPGDQRLSGLCFGRIDSYSQNPMTSQGPAPCPRRPLALHPPSAIL